MPYDKWRALEIQAGRISPSAPNPYVPLSQQYRSATEIVDIFRPPGSYTDESQVFRPYDYSKSRFTGVTDQDLNKLLQYGRQKGSSGFAASQKGQSAIVNEILNRKEEDIFSRLALQDLLSLELV